MAKHVLGIGTTDSNGNVVLADGYTGTGAGLVDILAEAVIDESSVVSEPYTVLDAIFKDRGTSSDYGTWTSTDFTGTKISRGDDYTTLTPEDTWDVQDIALSVSDNICVEFDVNLTYSEADDNHFLRFMYTGSNTLTLNPLRVGLTSGTWSHVKLTKNGTTCSIVVDGVSKPSQTFSSASLDKFRFILSNAKLTDMKYKNFVIYPI